SRSDGGGAGFGTPAISCPGTAAASSSSVHIPGFQSVRIGVGCHATPTVPPATWKICPLMFHASSLARNAAIGATYSGSRIVGAEAAGRVPAGVVTPARARSSRAVSVTVVVIRVAAPGAIALHVTPYRPRSFATTRVNPAIP